MTEKPNRDTLIRLSNDLDSAFSRGQKPRVREGQYPGISIAQVLEGARVSYDFAQRRGLVPALRGAGVDRRLSPYWRNAGQDER